jgi:hypothetical protein
MKVGRIGGEDTECEGGEGEKNECSLTMASIKALKLPQE